MKAAREAVRHFERGGAHRVAGRLKEAEAEFRLALAAAPGDATIEYALGTSLLAQGRYRDGFPLFERRHEVPQFRNVKPALPFPEWRGEALKGASLAIWPEQGFGDQIQCARFAPILKAQGADVTLLCSPALVRLFEPLGVRVVGASGAVAFPDPDAWVMCMSIAGRLGLESHEIPGGAYLSDRASPRGKGDLRIGLVTRGNPSHANDRHRSLSDKDAARLRTLPGELVDLDPAASGAKDFADTADIIAGLDLVISVDTAVAHLAGAMGKSTWLLAPAHNTDWRWGVKGETTCWYDSLRLFRQERPGDWSAPIAAVEHAAQALAEAR